MGALISKTSDRERKQAMATKAAEIIVQGEVQGVGFRWFVHRNATELGIRGCVRNRSDGAVEVYAEGEAAAIESLLGAVRVGPRAARVDDVSITWGTPNGNYSHFEISHG